MRRRVEALGTVCGKTHVGVSQGLSRAARQYWAGTGAGELTGIVVGDVGVQPDPVITAPVGHAEDDVDFVKVGEAVQEGTKLVGAEPPEAVLVVEKTRITASEERLDRTVDTVRCP